MGEIKKWDEVNGVVKVDDSLKNAEMQLEDDYVSYEIVEDDKELDMISDIFNALLDGLEVSL